MTIQSWPVERLPLSAANPAPYNPREDLQPGDPAYEDIRASLERFGLVDKLVLNKRTGNLVGGHVRYKQLAAAGVTETDFTVVDLNLEDEIELNLVLNNVKGRWDQRKLADVIHSLADSGRNLNGLGFSGEVLTGLLDTWQQAHGTDFLSSAFGATYDHADEDEEPDDGFTPSEQEVEQESDGPGLIYYQLSYAVTGEQRDVIRQALGIAAPYYGTENSIEALVALCADFIAQKTVGAAAPKSRKTGAEKLRIKNIHDYDGLHPLSVKVAKSIATGERFFANGHLGVDMLYLPPNGRFPLHTHPGDHLLLILEGTGTVTYGGVVYPTQPGDLYMVPGAVEHAVGAGPDGHKILAFGAPHKPLDSDERMTVTDPTSGDMPEDEQPRQIGVADGATAHHN